MGECKNSFGPPTDSSLAPRGSLFSNTFSTIHRRFTMNQRLIVSSALASVLAMGLIGQASAQDKGKEKCYGIAKAGQNDCANASGTHSCAGQSKNDMGADEWKYVAKGTCKDMKGMTADEVKAKK
jgi:uncharacterized membrane protein